MFRSQPGTAVSRTQVLGLDSLERNLGFFAAFIGFVAAGLALPPYISGRATKLTQTAKPSVHHLCSKGYHLVVSLCERVVLQTHSYWTFEFYGLLGMASLLLFAAFRKNRAMLIVIALIFGLIAGAAGFLFLALAAWLLIRAFRLQRSGTTQRPSRTRSKSLPGTADANPQVDRAAPAPSKRYTPKRSNRR
jgi:hypothetical protein